MSFPGFAHVAVTVSDLPASVAWYRQLTGLEPVLDEDTGPFYHVAFILADGALLALHYFPPGTADGTSRTFDEHRTGLDHISFTCADRAELEQWQERLEGLGVAHGGIIDAHYGSALSFRDPDNIALEFFAPSAPS
ncbi:VOC family protein [Streptomyces sp. NPDC002516]